MSSVSSQLRDIQSKSNESRFKLYEALVDSLVKSKNADGIVELVQHLVSREGADQYGRTYITPEILVSLVHTLEDKDKKIEDPIDLEDLTPIMKRVTDIVRPRAEDYPDALMSAIKLLSECYHAEGSYEEAARQLSSFNFDEFRGKCSASVEYRIEWFVQCAEFWLNKEVAKPAHASQTLKKAHALIPELTNMIKAKPTHELKSLLFQFKTVYARVLDNERKFEEAAARYLELSQTGQGMASEQDLEKALELAVTCGILAKAGPRRSRVLAMLYSDNRSQKLENYGLLEKMFKERIIRPAEVLKFEKMLDTHQNVSTSTGRTVLQNSVIEHNLLAASRLYHNCHFRELGVLLNISAAQAESLASTMIEQGRMNATIDQVEQLVEFVHDKQSASGSRASGIFGEWDASIEDVCVQVSKVTDAILAKHPQYAL